MKLIDILVEELPKLGGWPEDVEAITQDSDRSINNYRTADGLETNEYGAWRYSLAWQCYLLSHDDVSFLADDYTTAIITREQYEAALAAKNDGWIEWGGGECPVPCGTAVDVKHRCGAVSENQQAWPKHHKESDVMVNPLSNAGQAFWRHENSVMDIIAYRLHKPTKSEQVRADAWNAYAGITESDAESDLNECIGQDAAPVWDGAGLPPVGCECEVSVDGGRSWCTYRAINEKNGARLIEIGNFTEEFQNNNWIFRPIRSEADKKREAALDAIYGAIASAERAYNRSDEADKVYEAIAAGKIPGVKLED